MAVDRSYYERMTFCYSKRNPGSPGNKVYISRAYRSNHVFVYTVDSSNGKIYLHNMSGNVGLNIVDEFNTFDVVED